MSWPLGFTRLYITPKQRFFSCPTHLKTWLVRLLLLLDMLPPRTSIQPKCKHLFRRIELTILACVITDGKSCMMYRGSSNVLAKSRVTVPIFPPTSTMTSLKVRFPQSYAKGSENLALVVRSGGQAYDMRTTFYESFIPKPFCKTLHHSTKSFHSPLGFWWWKPFPKCGLSIKCQIKRCFGDFPPTFQEIDQGSAAP